VACERGRYAVDPPSTADFQLSFVPVGAAAQHHPQLMRDVDAVRGPPARSDVCDGGGAVSSDYLSQFSTQN